MDDITRRPFAFSYSKLKSYEICPKRYYEIDIKKAWPEDRSAQLSEGEAVHEAMAEALRGTAPLPAAHSVYQPWIDKVLRTPGELLVECKWAITAEYQPTPWMSPRVWLRSVADAVKLDGDAALLLDWKTGRSANADDVQLTLSSLVMFCHFPKLKCIRSDFIWLQEDDKTTQVLYRHEAADAWAEILPRVEKLRQATIEEYFPPTPNRFCKKWCPVKTCEFWGK
jgi:hypothetical protein